MNFYNSVTPNYADQLAHNEEFLVARAQSAFNLSCFHELYHILENNNFKKEHHTKLQNLWMEAHYSEAEKSKGRVLGAVDKFRVRKKFPFPKTIYDYGNLDGPMFSVKILSDASKLIDDFERLETSDNIDEIMNFYNSVTPNYADQLAHNEAFLVARAQSAFNLSCFHELYHILENNNFKKEHHTKLQDLWLQAHCIEEEKRISRSLSALDKYRLQKKYPFPQTIYKYGNLDVSMNSIGSLSKIAKLIDDCERLEASGDIDGIKSFFCVLPSNYSIELAHNEAILLASAQLAFHLSYFRELYHILENNHFGKEHHSKLQNLWMEAHYSEAEKSKGRVLGAVDKYRVRKKFPFPKTIYDYGNLDGPMFSVKILSDASKLIEDCERLEASGDIDGIKSFFCALPPNYAEKLANNETFLRVKAQLAFHLCYFRELYHILENNHFSKEHHSKLQNLWLRAHYIEEEEKIDKKLNDFDKFKLRKKYPLPKTICDE